MGIEKALEIFNISSIIKESKESLRWKYRKLMLKYHPDVYKGSDYIAKDISLAYELLSDLLTKLEQVNKSDKVSTLVITLNELVKIYSGETIIKDNIKINKSNMKKYNLFILSEVFIYHAGVQTYFSNTEQWNFDDRYNIKCSIYVHNMSETENIQIGILNTMKNIELNTKIMSIILTEKYNIKIAIEFSKKLRKGE